jgi:hypothetical protein
MSTPLGVPFIGIQRGPRPRPPRYGDLRKLSLALSLSLSLKLILQAFWQLERVRGMWLEGPVVCRVPVSVGVALLQAQARGVS